MNIYIKSLLAEEYGAVEGRPNTMNGQIHAWMGIRVSQGSQDRGGISTPKEFANSLVNVNTPPKLTTLTKFKDSMKEIEETVK